MDEQKALLKRIVSKIRVLRERHEEQTAALEVYQLKIIRMELRIKELESELEKVTTNKSIYYKTPGSGKSLPENKKAGIEKLVREIDHCLNLLNDNN
ncbi:MAG: hypothetical protein EOL88_04375 [Bacteroidia bacterium]|nr:hypothetical protein [Bacteroidales bacterium]MDD3011619.1 hypothetical protein [Bacteroidales bacterium]MDD3960861.1 hypothetical protein [Bacteroidales bacterium]MDY0284657.1 hypothetical protein [Bacteroidales bacterium]NCD41309.1 hypothetical protein [Bacteroidia bacterium]